MYSSTLVAGAGVSGSSPLVGSPHYCCSQQKREGQDMNQDLSQLKLLQPYCNSMLLAEPTQEKVVGYGRSVTSCSHPASALGATRSSLLIPPVSWPSGAGPLSSRPETAPRPRPPLGLWALQPSLL